jgi:hypothetical protein
MLERRRGGPLAFLLAQDPRRDQALNARPRRLPAPQASRGDSAGGCRGRWAPPDRSQAAAARAGALRALWRLLPPRAQSTRRTPTGALAVGFSILGLLPTLRCRARTHAARLHARTPCTCARAHTHTHTRARTRTHARTHTCARTEAAAPAAAAISTLKAGVARPGSVPAPAMLAAMVELEKAKLRRVTARGRVCVCVCVCVCVSCVCSHVCACLLEGSRGRGGPDTVAAGRC